MENEFLTINEAYKAMCLYLERLYNLTNSDDLGGFLGSMMLMDDGTTFDPAVWQDWLKAIQDLKSSEKS